MTYSVPVMEAARDEARKATRSAASFGRAGRPIGMPPRESIKARRPLSALDALLKWAALREKMPDSADRPRGEPAAGNQSDVRSFTS